MSIILLPDKAALFGDRATGEALRTEGVVVEGLRHLPILFCRHVGAAEVVGVEIRSGGIRGAGAYHRREERSIGREMCFVVVAVSELEATL